MALFVGRRGRIWAMAGAALVACVGVGGWAMAREEGAGTETAPGSTVVEPGPTTTVPAGGPGTTVGAAAVTLPVPAPLPADERAPTPEVVLGAIALPTLGIEQPLGEGVTLTALDRSPGHWPGTAMPGRPGNVVVAGHRTTHTRPFLDLDRLAPGDPLVFTMNDGTRAVYEHTETEIVAPDALHIVRQTPARTATLFACHPRGSAAQRIVSRFTLVER